MGHKLVSPAEWAEYPRRAFAAWFNQLEGLRSPVLVGTQSKEGIHNLAVFSSITHVGARPPLVGMVFRPLTVERDTYENMKATGFYTINHIPSSTLAAAHQTSASYPSETSEFEAVGLTPLASSEAAPYVKEASISMLLEFKEEHFIAANDTIFVVGAVKELRLPALAEFGKDTVDWKALEGLVVSGLYDYHEVEHFKKLGYAKP
ncbi:MAG: flavin reductase family protein [Saprospiraceae bacterium]